MLQCDGDLSGDSTAALPPDTGHCGGPHSISSVLRLIVPAHNLCRGKLCLPIHCSLLQSREERGEGARNVKDGESGDLRRVSTATVGVCEAG